VELSPRLSGEFRVVLDRPPPIDYPVPISVEVERDLSSADPEDLAREVTTRLQVELNFSAMVQLVPAGSIATEGKTRRVIRTYLEEVD
jgi:hypothetical protein